MPPGRATHYSVTLPHVVGWGECDATGMVYPPRFPVWFGSATWHFFESSGVPIEAQMVKYGAAGFPLVGAGMEVKMPARYRDRVEIEASIAYWRTKSFQMALVVRRGGDVIATGYETRIHALVDTGANLTIRTAPLPEDLHLHFQKLEAAFSQAAGEAE